MIRELTHSAWSILDKYHKDEQSGLLTREEAQKQAISRIEYLRYGDENKDYFWITDMQPVMIMHPYRQEMDGRDLANYADPEGKKLFVEAVNVVKGSREGYIDYKWQWKDDSTRVVPKLSYVKEFVPWNWIIGTGIYLEDVRKEIRSMTQKITIASFIIIALIGFILFLMTRRSLNTERKRQDAEQLLLSAKERYQALAESASEGILIVFEGNSAFANRNFVEKLGLEGESTSLDVILSLVQGASADLFSKAVESVRKGELPYSRIEMKIKLSAGEGDFMVNISQVAYAGQPAVLCLFRDITDDKKQSHGSGRDRIRFAALASRINIGVFRLNGADSLRFVEVNRATSSILGFDSPEQINGQEFSEIFPPEDFPQHIPEAMRNGKAITRETIQYVHADGSIAVIQFSAVPVPGMSGDAVFYDGILEDITRSVREAREKDSLITDLQASLQYLDMPVSRLQGDVLVCSMNEPIGKAISTMTKSGADAIVVAAGADLSMGIITDEDIRTRVIVNKADLNAPLFSIMSAPLRTVSPDTPLFEVMALMHDSGYSHIPVKSEAGDVTGIISARDLFNIQRSSFNFILHDLTRTDDPEEIGEIRQRLSKMIAGMAESGAGAETITRTVSLFSESVAKKVIAQAIEEEGQPPVPFAFLALGSEGREEPTLSSDQDNAIIYNPAGSELPEEEISAYFLRVANKVNMRLKDAGFPLCPGEVMAMNPRWTASITTWKNYFTSWIIESEPKDLMEFSVFFDFRLIAGDGALVDELRNHLASIIPQKPLFLYHLATNALSFKPPLNMFGNIVVQSSDQGLDLKKAVMAVIGFARIHALKHGVTETNTLGRIRALEKKGNLTARDRKELMAAYDFLMQLRFRNQASQIAAGSPPSNILIVSKLTEIEVSVIKKVFSVISRFQSRLAKEYHIS